MKKTVRVDTIAEAYVEMLAARGVKFFFNNGGSDFAPTIEAFAKKLSLEEPVPTPITCPHEITAVAMAHGFTMITGEPQAVMVHTIAGTANATGGMINAVRNEVPMLFTSGRTGVTEGEMKGARTGLISWGQDTHDQGGMLREWTKLDYELRHGADVQGVVDRALAIASSDPKGPVYLILPTDVMAEEAETFSYNEEPLMAPTRSMASRGAIQEAAAVLARAENPILTTRAGGRDPDSVAELVRLAEALSLPIYESMVPSHMNFPRDHGLYQGIEATNVIDEHDVIVSLEHDAPWSPGRKQPSPDAKVISIGADPLFNRIPLHSFQSTISLAGNVTETLSALADAVLAQPRNQASIEARANMWQIKHDELRQGQVARAQAGSDKRPLDKAWVSYCMEQVRDENTIIVNELGLETGQFRLTTPGTLFDTSTGGVLGWAIGAALGAKLAAPEKMVICSTGDGSYGYGAPTAAHWISRRYDLPVLYIVWNNSQLGAVTARGMYPDGHAVKLNNRLMSDLSPTVDFEKVVESCGGYGERVEDPEELPAAIERAFHAVQIEGRQALLNIIGGSR